MYAQLKQNLYEAIANEGYNITDSSIRKEPFPSLQIRLGGKQRMRYLDTIYSVITYTIDIFSTYPGEKEIMEIEEKITELAEELAKATPAVMGVMLKTCKILDDNSTGPVAKHGVLGYQFILEVNEEDDANERE
jgi:hypothetical protein